MSGMIKKILVTGGARSGKSRFALQVAEELGGSKVFIATAEALDDEMKVRIAAHRRDRGYGWDTVDEPLDLIRAVREAGSVYDVILVDCITLWMTNVYLKDGYEEAERGAAGFAGFLSEFSDANIVIVTNEVGSGIVPGNKMSREFRDITGSANQLIAGSCGDVYMVVCGIPRAFKKDGNICG